MSDELPFPRIARLPGALVNQIAAGEVIERPSSVVKELIENSIDAGASRIEVEIEGGGMEKIIVRDNGSGIHPEDMELAILRHSTSKIRSLQELVSIMSLGFRGEALSSIASVSDFRMTSRMQAAEHGWGLSFDPYGQRSSVSPAAHPPGTSVEVGRLFQPVPARRKFLRSDRTEFLHVFETVKRLVMSRLDVGFSMIHNGKAILNCPASDGDYRRRLKAIMGGRFHDNAWLIDSRAGEMRLWGWLGGGLAARSQSDRQYLCLNNRSIRDKRVNHAIRVALEEIIPASRYPSYILYLQLDPASADVNVHPTKQEVRFRHPRNIHDFIHAALMDGMKNVAPAPPGLEIRDEDPDTSYPGLHPGRPAPRWRPIRPATPAPVEKQTAGVNTGPWGAPVAVLRGRYVLCIQDDDLKIIDYRKLKQRYLSDRLRAGLSGGAVRERPLLVPLMLTLTQVELDLIEAHQGLLSCLGLNLEQTGPLSLAIRAFPAILAEVDIKDLLRKVLDCLGNAGRDADPLEESLLNLFAEQGSLSGPEERSPQDIERELKQMTASGLPSNARQFSGLWCSLSGPDLQKLLDEFSRRK